MLDLDQLKNNVAGGSLHSFISHVCIPKVGVADCAWSYFQSELLHSRDYLLGVAKVAFPANDFPFALAARADLSVEIVVAPPKFNSFGDATLASAFLACDYVIGVFCSSSLAVRTGYLFFYQHVKLFAEVEVFEFKEDFNFELWALELVEVELLVDIWIVHFLDTDSIVEVFFVLIVESLIGCLDREVPTLIFPKRYRDPGFRSGWYFLERVLNASRISSWLALTGSSSSWYRYLERRRRSDREWRMLWRRE
jgi:hypothetical protein